MAYDEPTYRRSRGDATDSSYLGESRFRRDADLRGARAFQSDSAVPYQQGSNSVSDYSTTDVSDSTLGLSRRSAANVSPTSLDDVFDDPDHGEPGRDRLAVHVTWELVLLIAIAALGFLFWRDHSEALRGTPLKVMLVFLTSLGMITLAAGLSLRVAAPNLAVGPVAMAAAVYFAREGDSGVVGATGFAVLVALGLGAVLAVLVVGFHVPGWAASLAIALVAIVWIQRYPGPLEVGSKYAPEQQALYLFGAFVGLAVLGGAVGAIRTVRRMVGRFRSVEDPARRRGGVAGGVTAAGLIFSTALAAVGGVLIAANDATVTPTTGLEWTGLAIGAALLGGTSAFGRRGGIFGTLFAVVLVGLFLRYEDVANWRISWFAIGAVLIVGGLVLTRMVESFGRPQSTQDIEDEDSDDGWMTAGGTQPVPGSSWSPPRQDSWSSSLPTQSTGGRSSDLWSDDRWGSRSST
jgi:ribose/xylose/arabinose/galactoside ABC-type transport system permease subunit